MSFAYSYWYLAVYRLMSLIVVRSWFVPDEVYQSTEVAHHMVYGTGHLSWEWHHALRSAIHPSIIAALYKLLQYLGIDSQAVVSIAPRVLHALIFALGDSAFVDLCKRLMPTKNGLKGAMLLYIYCWFPFYCASRTLSNALETALTLIALRWYPFEENPRRIVTPYISLGILTVVIRPTAALLWLVLGIHHLRRSVFPIRLILFTVIPAALPVLLLAVIFDSYFYGRITFSMWNFLSFNVFEGGSAHFGVHPWHWYFTQGLPSVLTIQLIPILFGLRFHLRPPLILFNAAAFYILFHSFLPHKEQRFLLPVIPFLIIYGGEVVNYRNFRSTYRTVVAFVVLAVNLLLFLYTGLRHQTGPYLVADSIIRLSHNSSVLALMPCYSLPGLSYFHTSLSELRQLDCSPDLSGSGRTDEADRFYEDPQLWLAEHREYRNFDFIVLYKKLFDVIKHILLVNYQLCANVFHADFPTSSRQDVAMVVLCKIKNYQ